MREPYPWQRTIPAEAGSAIVFEGRMWHGTGANLSNAPRLGFDVWGAYGRVGHSHLESVYPPPLPIGELK